MCRAGRITRALVLLAAAAGCTPFHYPLNVPSEEVRAGLGKIAVVVSPAPPELDLHRPPRGPIRGFGVGIVRGVVGAPLLGLWAGSHGFDPLSQALLMVVGAAVYPPVSIIGGAATSPSTGSVDRASRAIAQAHAVYARPERVRALFIGLAQRVAARPCSDAGFATLAEVRDGNIEFAGADSVVVLTWTKVTSTWTLGFVSTDKPCSIVTEIRMHVFRTSDRELVYHTRVGHMEPRRERTYRGWAFADATPLVSEIDRALGEMCTELVERLFLLDPDLHRAAGGEAP